MKYLGMKYTAVCNLLQKKKEKMDQWVNGGTENRQVCEETNMATC